MLKKIFLLLLIGLSISCNSGNKKDANAYLFEYCGKLDYKSPNHAEIVEAENQSTNLEKNWWKNSTFYHIWVKSFADSNNDGCGDFPGIQQNLDYIKELGFDGIWLSPIFECSYKEKNEYTNMHGYDTVNYYKVNSYFSGKEGTEETSENAEIALIELIKACHEKGIKIIFDFVPNHTSMNNKWFIDSYPWENPYGDSSKKDWYLWTKKYFKISTTMNSSDFFHFNVVPDYHWYTAFGDGMADLNFRNYEVREEMKNVVRYWLNKGFDGLRVDAVRYLMEDSNKIGYDTAETHEYFKELRKVIDQYESEKFMVAEAWISGNRSEMNKYFGNGDEFNMILDFDQGGSINNSVKNSTDRFTTSLMNTQNQQNNNYGTFLGNHDNYQDRLGTIFDGDYKKINLSSAISLLRPTTTFVYYGQELGDKNLSVDGDLAKRGNFDWDLAETEKKQNKSPYNLNKALLQIRKDNREIFKNGNIKLLVSSDEKVVSYLIENETDSLLCIFNLSNSGKSEITLTDFSKDSTENVCLIGDETQKLTVENNSAKITKLSPFGFRVYKIGTTEGVNLFNNEEYSESYLSKDEIPSNCYIPETMYLKGDFTSWGENPCEMSIFDETNTRTFYADLQFPSSASITYKFCVNKDDWEISYGNKNDSSAYNNITQSVTAGKAYRFAITFNKNTGDYNFEFYELN